MPTQIPSRRNFLKTIGVATIGASIAPASLLAQGESRGIYTAYARQKIGSLSEVKKSGELDFFYPDSSSMCKALFIDGKVSAYSTLCTHKGCPMLYDPEEKVFNCPCHYSRFDAQKDGLQVIGQATAKLPRIHLEIEGDDLYAIGVDGLIFGRYANFA